MVSKREIWGSPQKEFFNDREDFPDLDKKVSKKREDDYEEDF